MKIWLCGGIVLVCLATLANAQTSIYKQDVDAGDGFSSTYDSTAVFAFLAADNFSLSSTQTIGSVRWWGNGDGFGSPNLTNFTQYTVTLLQRLPSGLPGAVIDQESFATANTNPVDTHLISFSGTDVWQQTAALTLPQTLTAGEYMLSVGVSGYVDNQGAIWYWNTSLQGDGYLAYDAYDGDGWRQFAGDVDLSFELISVPEPGAAMGLLSASLVLARRRRCTIRATPIPQVGPRG